MEEYPFYIYPDIEALRRGNLTYEQEKYHKRRIAVNIGNEGVLRRIFSIDPEEFASFYPDLEKSTPSTLDTIDSFLSHFGSKKGSHDQGIDSLSIADIEESTQVEIAKKPSIQDAYSYIREKRYEDALEIISELNLNNPEKNIYFADQIRFLKKLIYNESLKKT